MYFYVGGPRTYKDLFKFVGAVLAVPGAMVLLSLLGAK